MFHEGRRRVGTVKTLQPEHAIVSYSSCSIPGNGPWHARHDHMQPHAQCKAHVLCVHNPGSSEGSGLNRDEGCQEQLRFITRLVLNSETCNPCQMFHSPHIQLSYVLGMVFHM